MHILDGFLLTFLAIGLLDVLKRFVFDEFDTNISAHNVIIFNMCPYDMFLEDTELKEHMRQGLKINYA